MSGNYRIFADPYAVSSVLKVVEFPDESVLPWKTLLLNCNQRLTHLRRQIITVELAKSERTYRCKNIWCTSKGAPFKERFRQRQRRGERKGWRNTTGYNDGYCFSGFLIALRHLGYPLIYMYICICICVYIYIYIYICICICICMCVYI